MKKSPNLSPITGNACITCVMLPEDLKSPADHTRESKALVAKWSSQLKPTSQL